MKNLLLILSSMMWLIAACGSDTPAETPIPTMPPMIGGVTIESPAIGAVIYAEAIYVSGSAEGIDNFRLQIETIDNDILYDATVIATNGHWVIEVVHSYADEPTEILIRALPTDNRITLQYDEVAVVLAPLAYRPDGVFGSILSPRESQAVGGDAIEVNGTASGVADNRVTLLLRNDEEMIDKQVIVQVNPYHIDERTWSADLLTNGYTGQAIIDLSYYDSEAQMDVILDSISILIGSAAG